MKIITEEMCDQMFENPEFQKVINMYPDYSIESKFVCAFSLGVAMMLQKKFRSIVKETLKKGLKD